MNEKMIFESIKDDCLPFITQASFKKFQALISRFADSNSDVLQTNIMGRQLLFSEKIQDEIFKIFNIKKEKVLELIDPKKTKSDPEKTSAFFISLGGLSMNDQLSFLIPIEVISALYLQKKQDDEAFFIYTTMFFKPYATRISRYFKYGVNDSQMLYTMETLNDRFDLKKEGTIFNLIAKMSNSSFQNYKSTLFDGPTDKDLYIIATAGCYTRINMSIQNIFKEYMKNSGKRLDFEASFKEVEGDEGDIEEIENEIKSESVIKTGIIKKALNTLTTLPVNEKFLMVAVQKGFNTSKISQLHMSILRNLVNEVIEKKLKELPELLDTILSSFIQQINPATKMRFKAEEIRTPVFLNHALKAFKNSPNSKDPNTLRMREIMTDFLESCSPDYLRFEKNGKRSIRTGFFMYLILVLRSS